MKVRFYAFLSHASFYSCALVIFGMSWRVMIVLFVFSIWTANRCLAAMRELG